MAFRKSGPPSVRARVRGASPTLAALAAASGLVVAVAVLGAPGCISGATPDCSLDAGNVCGRGFDAGDASIDAILAMAFDAVAKPDAAQDAEAKDAPVDHATHKMKDAGMDAGIDTGVDAGIDTGTDAPPVDAPPADAPPVDAPPADAQPG